MREHEKETSGVDLARLRAKLQGTAGRNYWRGLDELADSEEFQKYLHAEFPEPAAFLDTPLSRRGFLRVMGASLALAGLNACTRQPTEKIFPYVKQPEEIIPGEPLFFASAFVLDGFASGVLVESHLGRPTKIEGNPEHPASRGATGVHAQASVLDLYDPDRAQITSRAGEIRPWSAFVDEMGVEMKKLARDGGRGLRILTESVTSPTLASQIRQLLVKYPGARWHQYQPVNDDSARRAAIGAFGEHVDVRHALEKADVIVSLDADFLASGPAHVRLAREFADRRRVDPGDPKRATMNRLYVVEPTMTLTGAKADHRLRRAPRDVEVVARRLAMRLGLAAGTVTDPSAEEAEWLAALVRDLKRHRGRSLVIAGQFQSPAVHALAHALNRALGNVGSTVSYVEPVVAEPVVHADSLRSLVDEMDAEKVNTLIVLGGNPVYSAPGASGFAEALAKVGTSVHLSLDADETSEQCTWHVSAAHPLESWSDARSETGLVTILQPLIDPLYDGKTAHEIIAVLSGDTAPTAYDLVRAYWKGRTGDGFDAMWRTALHDGVVPGTEAAVRTVSLKDRWRELLAVAPAASGADTVDVVIRPDPHLHDGRFANNAWLHELPKPISRLTWDNAVHVGPGLAAAKHLENGDVVRLQAGEQAVDGPVWIVPGMAADTVEVTLGYGRRNVGRVGKGVGFDVAPLRSLESPWLVSATLTATGATHALVTTQSHGSMEGRHLVREGTLEGYREHPDFVHDHDHIEVEGKSMFPPHPYDGYAWGMVIDLAACIGCNACTIACQAENNIPVVGKEQVAVGREMHWIRVDRYFNGEIDEPAVVHQPVPCMHCENAPCELVCPVNATVHDSEGLNAMVYNRCVGTRYCANNCPYKVRRYNFFLYTDWTTETQKMLNNPDVTVRSRGIMEKCTYCTQRINQSRIVAKRESRGIREGELETACQQACPTEAISFGDLNDPSSRVAAARKDPRNYALLGELGTKPRTTYLAEMRNPNPEIAGRSGGQDDSHGKGHG